MTKKNVLLLDGGMGQELYRRNVRGEEILWSANALMTHPQAVKDIHFEFLKAGANVITTNTYSTNPDRLRRAGVDASEIQKKSKQLIEIACQLACQAKEDWQDNNVQIAGSMPPIFGSYRPELVRSHEEMVEEYSFMAKCLAPYCDILLFETLSTCEEVRAALEAAHNLERQIWISITLKDNEAGVLRSGATMVDVAKSIENRKITALLINCCAPESIAPTLETLAGLTDVTLGAYANGFQPIPEKWKAGDIESLGVRQNLGPKQYLEFVKKWLDKGASIVGGCCEIGPEHIRVMSDFLKTREDID